MNTETVKNKIKSVIPVSILPEFQKLHVILLDIDCMVHRVVQSLSGNFGINFLVVSTGQACNFKCRDCANFAPVSPKKYRRYELDDILSSLDKIIKSVSYINVLQIQGGEPFLYSELSGILSYLGGGQKEKIHEIVIATNGSIVPSDELMEVIHDSDAEIRISNYGRFPDELAKLIQKCQKYKIRYRMYEFGTGDSTWFYCGGLHVKREDSVSVVRERFYRCAFRNCLTLERGELAYCSRGRVGQRYYYRLPL